MNRRTREEPLVDRVRVKEAGSRGNGPASVNPLPHSLPHETSSFVGRARELEDIADALTVTRLLTLTGAGGSGKTRLALQAAAKAQERFPQGVWWLELASLTEPALVGERLAAVLGVRPSPGTTALEACCAHLAGHAALVVIDNCEHLLDACYETATALLESCPRVKVLATSRTSLGLLAEMDWRVPPLSLPPRHRTSEPLIALAQCDAVRLFVERATKVRPDFAVTPHNAAAVTRICHELDGIPLALEFAAARLRMLSVFQIADALGDRFRVLTGGSRRSLPRRQTLRASVDWSYNLLGQQERILFRRLGVFAGGFTLAEAEAVAAVDVVAAPAVLDLLSALVDQSMVLAEERSSVVRYRMLETLRHYALEHLEAAGEMALLQDRHRDAFLELAERAAPHLESAREREWLDLLDAEAGNLAVALNRAVSTDPERALRFGVALTFWWRVRGRFAEAEVGYASALAVGVDAPPALRARALSARAGLNFYAGAFEAATAHAAEALVLADAVGDASTSARALIAQGRVRFYVDPGGARPGLERAAALAQAHGDTWAHVEATQVLALSHLVLQEHEACQRLLEQVDELVAYGCAYHRARQAFLRGSGALRQGRYVDARAHLERTAAISDEMGEPVLACLADAYLCTLDAVQGLPEQALLRASSRLEQASSTGAQMTVPYLLLGTAYAECVLGRLRQARDRLEPMIPLVEQHDVFLAGQALALLSTVQRLLGAPDAAQQSADRGLEIATASGNRLVAGENHLALARLAAASADWGRAERHVYALLDVCDEGGHDMYAPGALEALAEVSAGLGNAAESVRLLAAAARACHDLGMVRWRGEDHHWAQLAYQLRDTLGEDGFADAWARGELLDLREAMGWARRTRGHRRRPSHGWESLTPTELEVVRQVVVGLTNPQIGERLFISRATVKVHLAHVFAKLAISSRAQLAAEATRRGVAAASQPPAARS